MKKSIKGALCLLFTVVLILCVAAAIGCRDVYAALSWSNKQISDGNENSMPTAKALYLYNQAAKAYLH